MQHYNFKDAVSPFEVTVVYQSRYYTVSRASVFVSNGNGEKREVFAEGVARRSHMDMNDPTRGKEIASGRALKALAGKLAGVHCTHLLMNG